jgi:hypothetical protein
MLFDLEQRINRISCSYLPFLQTSSLGVSYNRKTYYIKTVLNVRIMGWTSLNQRFMELSWSPGFYF